MAMYQLAIHKYGVFLLSLTGMVVNCGAIVHLVKQEWVELWFPLSTTVPLRVEEGMLREWPVQGDQSGCSLGFVDINTKAEFQYIEILETQLLF